MKVIIVGGSDVTRLLLRRLGETWDVTVVDLEPARFEALKRERKFRSISGDGSSRVVLNEAGLDEADALVAATGDDERNLEIVRMGLERSVTRVVGIAEDPDRFADYRELGIPVFSPSDLASRQIELQLEARRVSSKAFAEGRLEAFEFRVEENSPVRGFTVQQLTGPTRVVASVVRRGKLLMPHEQDGLTLEAGDLVTVFGVARELPNMIESFTTGRARFPLDFGKRVAVALVSEADLGKSFVEAVTITRNSQATSLVVVRPEVEDEEEDVGRGFETLMEGAKLAAEGVELTFETKASPDRAVEALPEEASIGVLVKRSPAAGVTWLPSYRIARSISLARRTQTPVLFATGRHSYERIVVAARKSPAGKAAARAAIDLAEMSNAELTALAVVDPAFAGGPRGPDEARAALEWVRGEAGVHKIDVAARMEEGNPVHAFVETARDADLVILGMSEDPKPFRPRLINHVVKRTRSSTLVVPAAPHR